MDGEKLEAAGWQAIDEALHPLYADQRPKHFGTLVSYELGGRDPLCSVSAYWRDLPVPHWHFITYGFTELFGKDNPDADISGFGFELTFRLAGDGAGVERDPPEWVLGFLQNLARYVFDSGNVFRAGHYLNTNGPIAPDEPTQICAIAFIGDPELPPRETPNGTVEFLQIVGLTADEEFALKQWTILKALDVFQPYLPLYVTDLRRTSLLNTPQVHEALRAGAQRDGSGTGRIFADQLEFDKQTPLIGNTTYMVSVGASQIRELLILLPLRLPFGRDFELIGRDTNVCFTSAQRCSVGETDGGVVISLTRDALDEICATLKAQAGTYSLNHIKNLVFDVVETLVRDNDGNVVETVG